MCSSAHWTCSCAHIRLLWHNTARWRVGLDVMHLLPEPIMKFPCHLPSPLRNFSQHKGDEDSKQRRCIANTAEHSLVLHLGPCLDLVWVLEYYPLLLPREPSRLIFDMQHHSQRRVSYLVVPSLVDISTTSGRIDIADQGVYE